MLVRPRGSEGQPRETDPPRRRGGRQRREDRRPAGGGRHRLPVAGPQDQLAPERLAAGSPLRGQRPHGSAETVPGPSTDHFAALAKRLGVYITVPLVEIDPGPATVATSVPPATAPTTRPQPAERFFNTVCLVSPEGKLVAHYRKLTPWPYPEKSWATPGDRGLQTHDTEYGRVGLAICFDIHQTVPKYRDQHLWALLYPIAWVDTNHPAPWFWHHLPARVAGFHHYVIGANWSVDKPAAEDQAPDWFGYGFSTILSPEGKVLATAKSLYDSEIVYAEIETQSAREKRP